MIFDKDKHLHNVSNFDGWGEWQIAGELLASTYVNHRELERYKVQSLFAIRVIGTRFTFYRSMNISVVFLRGLYVNIQVSRVE